MDDVLKDLDPIIAKHLAFLEALKALFEEYPVPGNPNDPKKEPGIRNTIRMRQEVMLWNVGIFGRYTTLSLAPLAKSLKVTPQRLRAIHTLLYG